MNLKPKTVGLALVSLLAFGELATGQSQPPGPTDFAAFSKFVADRNIFNPDRIPHSPRNSGARPPRPARIKAAPAFAFVGAMQYGKGMFAFFDGNNDDYRKSLQLGGQIAGYTVQQITLGGVRLAAGTNSIFLLVGGQLRQSGEGIWELADEPLDLSSRSENSGSAATPEAGGSASAPAAPAGEMSDVLKRLMKLREQENK